MKYKKKMQVLSGVLSAIMMVTMVPFEALATEIESSEETSSQSISLDEFDDKLDTSEFIDARDGEERYIVSEVLEGRDQYTKTFRLNTGERMICEYEIPVHYEDENGVWQEYDNSLEEVTETVSVEVPTMEEEETPSESDVIEEDPNEDLLEPSDEQPAEQEMTSDPDLDNNTVGELTAGPQFAVAGSSTGVLGSLAEWFTGEEAPTTEEVTAYQNLNSDVSVQITEESRENQMVTMSQDDTSVRWGFLDSNAAQAQMIVALSEEELDGDDAFTSVDISSEALYYEDVYDSVDLQCFVGPTFVKDNFILNDATAQNIFQIVYELDGLTPEQAGDKAIYLKDEEGTIQYTIAAPYMMDTSGECSDQLSLQIVDQKDQYLFVELTADREWLLGEGRTYPVTIDPVVQTKQNRTVVDDAFYSSKDPNKAYGETMGSMFIGYSGSYGKTRAAIRLNSLPTLDKSDKIVAAYLSLVQIKTSTDLRVDVHEATSAWSESGVTWNTAPAFNENTIIEYVTHKSTESANSVRTYDITKSVQKWYNGEPNYGIILRTEDENSTSNDFVWYYSSTYTGGTSMKPLFSIVYRNNQGLESYWSYSSIGAGEAGTAYINNYSGNLVFEQSDIFTTGVNKPLNVSHYYNGYMAGKQYGSDLPGQKLYAGSGWKLNVHRTLLPSSKFGLSGTSATNYPYVYTDDDGTDHYFYKTSSGAYKDEDGLGLSLKVNSSSASARYTISDDKNNKMVFNSNGDIQSITEAAGAAHTYTYASDGKTIAKITDGNGKYVTFTVNSSGYLTEMKDSTSDENLSRTVSYTYQDGKYLTGITGYDGHTATYSYYDDRDYLLKTAQDAKGNTLTFTYTSSESGSRVASVTSTTPNGTQISKTTFEYPDLYTTIVRNSNTDGEINTSDDIIETYSFDTYGRTTAIHYESNGKDLGTECYQYTDGAANSTASNIKKLNRVTREHVTGVEVINPLNNHNMERTTSWTGGSFTTEDKYYGNQSLVLTAANDTQTATQTVTLTSGKTYTLSGYVKTTGISGEGEGASLKLTVGSDTFSSDYLNTNTDTAMDEGWRRLSVCFTMPDGSTSATAQLTLSGVTGTAYFDAIQIEEGKVPGAYNMLENAGLEVTDSDNSHLPKYWGSATLNPGSTIEDMLVNDAYAGNQAFKLHCDPSDAKQIFQDVPTTGTEEDTYVVSGWAKATALPQDSDKTRQFLLSVRVTYTDNTTLYKHVGYFNPCITDWQYVTASVTMSDNKDSTTKNVKAVALALRYQYEAQEMIIDNLQLIKEAVPTYTYDDDGNLVSVKENANQNSQMEYTGGNLTKSIDAKGFSYTYDYNDNKTLKKATSQTGVNYNYTYEGKGRPTQLVVEDNDSSTSTKIQTNTAYTSGKSYVASETDANGNTINYTYVNGIGNLATSSTTVSNRTITNSYTYQQGSNLPLTTTQTVTSADGSTESKTVTNTYDSYHQLTGITSPTSEYSFTYNDAGQAVSTAVGDYTLATNSYSQGGVLTGSTYGNGFQVGYQYDEYGNIIEKTFDGETAIRYYTDNTGTIVRADDYLSDYRYENVFDSLGRTIRTSIFDRSSAAFQSLLSFEYDYDLNNNVSKYAVETPDGSYVSEYTYGKDNLMETATLDGVTYNYSYDKFNRLTGVAADNLPTQSYTYKESDRGSDYTTYQVASETIGEDTFAYTYDEAGNITAINSGLTYEYDGFGQLVRENDQEHNRTTVYAYDDGGNITSKTIYPYTTGALGSESQTTIYGYTDETWGDLLTSYNGQTLTYDAVGNPLNYRDGITLTWKNGRRLATYSKDGQTISYDYDADGVRTKKVAGNTTYTYVYAEDQLTYETRGSESFTYLYDSDGTIRKLVYKDANGTVWNYYYLTNSRGDVVGLYDTEAGQLVTYTYDAWGNLQTMEDDSPNLIGEKNPIRYRGYYQDSETGFYYLQSRYYDPFIGRFLNADDVDILQEDENEVLQYNIFAYCFNDPVNLLDNYGDFAQVAVLGFAGANIWNPAGWVAIAAVVVVTVASYAVSHYVRNQIIKKGSSIFYKKTKPQTGINARGGHNKNARNSTKQKHEKGDARRKLDQGGSKARNHPNFVSRSNKTHQRRKRPGRRF